jgi:hypothetical protein
MPTEKGVVMVNAVRRSLTVAGGVAGNAVMLVWSNGGQSTARRNAWAAMVQDSRRTRDRVSAASTLAMVGPAAVDPVVAAVR